MSRAPQKRFLDIEMALRWAFRDELPKRDRTATPRHALNERVWSPYLYPAGYGEASPMFRDEGGGGPSGGYADGWSRDPGFPLAMGGPHVDAHAIEAAAARLAAWRGHSFGPGDPAGLAHGFAGLEVDHVSIGAEAVAMMAGLVTCHARAGTRPPWPRELPRPYPDKGGNGKPRVLIDETFVETVDRRGRVRYEEADPRTGERYYTEPIPCPPTRKGLYRTGAYCPLEWRPDPAMLIAERAAYAAWRMGLEVLQRELEGKLESIVPLPPAAPWRPWAGEREAHGPPPELFRGQRDDPYRGETRERAAMRRRAGMRRDLERRAQQTGPIASGNRNLKSAR